METKEITAKEARAIVNEKIKAENDFNQSEYDQILLEIATAAKQGRGSISVEISGAIKVKLEMLGYGIVDSWTESKSSIKKIVTISW